MKVIVSTTRSPVSIIFVFLLLVFFFNSLPAPLGARCRSFLFLFVLILSFFSICCQHHQKPSVDHFEVPVMVQLFLRRKLCGISSLPQEGLGKRSYLMKQPNP